MKLIQLGILSLFTAIIILTGCDNTNVHREGTSGSPDAQGERSAPSAESKMGDTLSTDGNNDVDDSDTL